MLECASSRSLLSLSRSAMSCQRQYLQEARSRYRLTCCSHCLNRASSSLTWSVNRFRSASSSSLNWGLSTLRILGSPNLRVSSARYVLLVVDLFRRGDQVEHVRSDQQSPQLLKVAVHVVLH